jgi:hypothetical protein
MTRDAQPKPNPDENAAPIVAGPEARAASEISGHLEPAWLGWSKGVQNVDERTITLLRSAFEAGFEAGEITSRRPAI